METLKYKTIYKTYKIFILVNKMKACQKNRFMLIQSITLHGIRAPLSPTVTSVLLETIERLPERYIRDGKA